DIFGVLTDVLHQTISLYGQSLEYCEDLWTITRSLIRDVKSSWRKPDRSIWEFRSAPRHYTFSRVLCWVAADRGARIASLLGQNSYAEEWSRLARKIHDDVMKNGWNEDRGAFTQSYGDDSLDAANLLMAHYHFIEPLDHRYIATVHKTFEELSRDGLILRYSNADDFGFSKTSFTICTFWMVKSLALIGETEKARRIYEKVLSYGNHLGLFSEGIDTVTRRLLGNFPQAYSHLALIDAGLALTKREAAIGTQDQRTEPQAFDLVGAVDEPGT
ncbi:MAG: glycoside hydrolase family 15 protein, partial [Candidatus Aminicenantes bacterium]|nr:glycoside hydrolase family 15 protein [Candidatus Aminicenantes bacterium]